MPTFDVDKEGHKFPFNACELLISDNGLVTERFFEETEVEVDSDEEKEEDESKDGEKQKEDNEEEKKEDDKKEDVKERETKEEEKKDEEKKEDDKQETKVEEKKEEETNLNEKKEETTIEVNNVNEKKEENETKELKAEEHKEEEINEDKNEIKSPEEEKPNNETKEEEEAKVESINDTNKEETSTPTSEDNEKKEDQPNDNEEEEDSDQNPDAKTKTQYYNIDYFFQFLDRPIDNSNSVLLGYFFKILYHLIQLDSKTMISYIFDPSRKSLTKKLIKILTTKSSIESIKCLLTESSNIIPNYYELRKNFCMELLTELNDCNDNNDKCETITNIFKSCLSSKPFFNYIMSDNTFLILLFSIPYKYTEQPWNLQYVLKLLIEINENVLKMFPKRVTPNLIVEQFDFASYNFDMKYALEEDKAMSLGKEENDLNTNLEYLFNSLIQSDFEFLSGLDNYDDATFDSTYQKPQKKLGIARLTQVEYFRSILDILVNANAIGVLQTEINNIINLANSKNIFWTLIDIFYAYEFNNMYQTIFRQIMTIILNENSPELLVKSIFSEKENKKFLSLLVNHCYESTKSLIVQQPTNSGFFPTEIQLLSDISNSGNQYVKEIIKDDQDLNVFISVFAEQINTLFNQKLLSSDNNDISSLYNKNEEYYTPKQKTMDEIIEQNKEIYKVYKEGGDYKALLNKKKEEEQKLKEATEKEEANKLASSIPLDDNSEEENAEETDKGLKGSHFFEEEENEEPKTQSLKDSHFFGDLNENPKAEDDEEEEENKENEKYNSTQFWSTPLPTYNNDDIMKELSEL